MAGEWKTLGSLKKSKAGNLYLDFKEGATIAPGDKLMLQDPRKGLKDAAAKGRMTEEQAEERIAKIPEFVKYDIVRGPKD